MEKKKAVLLASVVAAGLLSAAPAFASDSNVSPTQINSASNVVLSVDSYGRPSVNGENIANLVPSIAKIESSLQMDNYVCGLGCSK